MQLSKAMIALCVPLAITIVTATVSSASAQDYDHARHMRQYQAVAPFARHNIAIDRSDAAAASTSVWGEKNGNIELFDPTNPGPDTGP